MCAVGVRQVLPRTLGGVSVSLVDNRHATRTDALGRRFGAHMVRSHVYWCSERRRFTFS